MSNIKLDLKLAKRRNNSHFLSVMLEPDAEHFDGVLLEQLPDVGLAKSPGVVPDVDLVSRPAFKRKHFIRKSLI